MDNTVDDRVASAFRALTREEFARLSLDERMDYLHRAMHELRARLEESRQQAAKIPK